MATLSTTRNYEDGEILTQADLDAFLDDIETFVNVTKLNDDNLQNNGITGSSKLVTGSVTAAKLATDSVTTAKIVDSNVTTAKIADSNVTTVKIADDNVTFAKMQNISTQKLIGRTTSGSGDPEEIGVSAAFNLTSTTLSLSSASKAEMEAASSTSVAVTPGRTQNHPGVAKAVAVFDASGTLLGGSYGVTSVVNDSATLYTITFSTAFSTAEYGTIGMVQRSTGGGVMTIIPSSASTTSIQVRITDDGGGNLTSARNTLVAFGDQ